MHGHWVILFISLATFVSSQLLDEFPEDFEPVLSKLHVDSPEKVKIAKAVENLEVEGHKAIAKVIKHTNPKSRIARTVIIQNSPEALKAFGVRNVPSTYQWEKRKRSINGKRKSYVTQEKSKSNTNKLNSGSFPSKPLISTKIPTQGANSEKRNPNGDLQLHSFSREVKWTKDQARDSDEKTWPIHAKNHGSFQATQNSTNDDLSFREEPTISEQTKKKLLEQTPVQKYDGNRVSGFNEMVLPIEVGTTDQVLIQENSSSANTLGVQEQSTEAEKEKEDNPSLKQMTENDIIVNAVSENPNLSINENRNNNNKESSKNLLIQQGEIHTEQRNVKTLLKRHPEHDATIHAIHALNQQPSKAKTIDGEQLRTSFTPDREKQKVRPSISQKSKLKSHQHPVSVQFKASSTDSFKPRHQSQNIRHAFNHGPPVQKANRDHLRVARKATRLNQFHPQREYFYGFRPVLSFGLDRLRHSFAQIIGL